ncbi:hypothetical protein T484DRAFT_1867521 [Baffinella frigidus]|nr:hypothetical protein T484DRAFT_1867521 [Cryptophyta sp. CCMP2293]
MATDMDKVHLVEAKRVKKEYRELMRQQLHLVEAQRVNKEYQELMRKQRALVHLVEAKRVKKEYQELMRKQRARKERRQHHPIDLWPQSQ